ncbi:hypothetical protein AGMMS50267_10010 [Spirochaetia bacterium]|nr:hypothetical protein AGMMS50267_10010 [Spirochaetia bacterium]
MKISFKTSIIVVSLAASLVVSSCKFIQDEPPPYVVSKPVCLIEAKPGYFNFAGIEFDFFNASEKAITNIYLSFMVYDADTKKNPFIGSNVIKMSFDGVIKQQEQKKFFISLDNYSFTIPAKPYLIDFFCVTKIIYEDTSQWEDPSGVYYTNSYE